MKDIGDKLRRCSKGVCRLKNLDHQIIEKVLDGPFVAIVVRVLIYYLILSNNLPKIE